MTIENYSNMTVNINKITYAVITAAVYIKISNNELNEVVKVFTAWEKIEKAMYYQSIINKRHKEQDQ